MRFRHCKPAGVCVLQEKTLTEDPVSLLAAENSFKKGLLAIAEHRYHEAVAHFRSAVETHERRRGIPVWRHLSYYGLSMARAHRPATPEAIRACEVAAARAGRADAAADLYWNLGQVYLLAGKTDRALEAFASGLRLDPAHPGLRRALESHDRRRMLFPCLGRANALNRWFGRAAAAREGTRS